MASTSRPERAGVAAQQQADLASPVEVEVFEALELPLDGPRRFWLGFVFVDDRGLARRARLLADRLVHDHDRELEVHAAPNGNGAQDTARAVLRHGRTESTVWLDWTALGASDADRSAVDGGLALLNTTRTRLTRSLRGGLVLAMPSWAEMACARGAVDLWSGREFALRLRPYPMDQHESTREAAWAHVAEMWREFAPITVLRALREGDIEDPDAVALGALLSEWRKPADDS